MNTSFQEDKSHEGYNLKRIREIMGLKQEALGDLCPSKFSQQRISEFESMIQIDEPILEELAAALGVTSEFVRNFKEEKVIYNIQSNRNTFKDHSKDQSSQQHYQPTITNDAADKLTSLLEKFIEEDRTKTESITALSKAVLELAEEVKKLKSGEL
ncbi:helix-turn-helix domain-containing protein [Parapedobacter sp. DT-150]|uniref:helix-turn-helix domain-containing protein n=1 Tax=Parapedobacter sp. DT-150 TaxID=3396162 RepID=UPI003F1A7C40